MFSFIGFYSIDSITSDNCSVIPSAEISRQGSSGNPVS